MDSTKENLVTDLEEDVTATPVTFEWKSENNTALFADTITLTPNALNPNGGVSLTSPYTFAGTIGTGFSNTTYTTSSVGTGSPWYTNSVSPKIQLNGEGADVEVNGWSLVAAVTRIEERLGLFQPNPELEQEWSDLRALGEQYRKLEQHIRDKQATFDRLKAMPAPEIE